MPKRGVFRQARQEYVTDLSVSQINVDKESLCKVSGYEISWHSTYTLPKLASINKFKTTFNWLHENGLGEAEETPKKTVILKQIISRGAQQDVIEKKNSTEGLNILHDDDLGKKQTRKVLNRNSSFITKLQDVIAKEIGDTSSNENLDKKNEICRTQKDMKIVESVDVGTEPPSFCKIPTVDISVGTDPNSLVQIEKYILERDYINTNMKESCSSTTIMGLLEERLGPLETTPNQIKIKELASISNEILIVRPNTSKFKTPNSVNKIQAKSKHFTGFKTKTKVSCRKKQPVKAKKLDENLKLPDITITIYDEPGNQCRKKSFHKSESQVCSTKHRPTNQTKSSVNLSRNENKKRKIPVLAKHRFQGSRKNKIINKPEDGRSNIKMNSNSNKPMTEISARNNKEMESAIFSNKPKAGDGPDLSPTRKLDKERCDNHSAYLEDMKNYLMGAYTINKEEMVCNMEIQTTTKVEELKENSKEYYYVTDQTTQTPTPELLTQQISLKNVITPKRLRKSSRSIKLNEVGTQMYEYFTPSQLYCREWIQQNLFHMEHLNPYTIKIDCRINNDSTRSSWASSVESKEMLSNIEYAKHIEAQCGKEIEE